MNEYPIFSLNDIFETLEYFEDDDPVWNFVSMLTGISVDGLSEKLDAYKSKSE